MLNEYDALGFQATSGERRVRAESAAKIWDESAGVLHEPPGGRANRGSCIQVLENGQ